VKIKISKNQSEKVAK